MRDFTTKAYMGLLETLNDQDFSFQNVEDFIQNSKSRTIILRHDVDALPQNSLRFARIQSSIGIKGSYYFRAVPQSFDEAIIKEIASLGHEIGYHYECLTTCNGNLEKAFDDFQTNLEKLRTLAPVATICMHGSPRSRWDSKNIWKAYDYRKLGILGEPYLDLDFDRLLYLTDTGRRWEGWKVSIRDKMAQQTEWIGRGLVFRTTWDIISAANVGKLPEQIMMTFHPQRWTDNPVEWTKELVLQNFKNVIKKYFYVGR